VKTLVVATLQPLGSSHTPKPSMTQATETSFRTCRKGATQSSLAVEVPSRTLIAALGEKKKRKGTKKKRKRKRKKKKKRQWPVHLSALGFSKLSSA
jgi:hypothetical protein